MPDYDEVTCPYCGGDVWIDCEELDDKYAPIDDGEYEADYVEWFYENK